MTTISGNSVPSTEGSVQRRIALNGTGGAWTNKAKEMTAEQKAELSQKKSAMAAADAALEKQFQAEQKRISAAGMESHEMYMPNVSDLSLENAKKSLGIAQVMIKNKEDVGVNVHGRYGDQEISDLHTYTVALKDFIGKLEAATAETGAGATQVNTTAASTYRQMQEMMRNAG